MIKGRRPTFGKATTLNDIDLILEVLADKVEGQSALAYAYLEIGDDHRRDIHLARAAALREFAAELEAARISLDDQPPRNEPADRRTLVISEVAGPYRASVHEYGRGLAAQAELEADHRDLVDGGLLKSDLSQVEVPTRTGAPGSAALVDIRWVCIVDIHGGMSGSLYNSRAEADARKGAFDVEEECEIEAGGAWATWHAVLIPMRAPPAATTRH